jgi:hypothetical protein
MMHSIGVLKTRLMAFHTLELKLPHVVRIESFLKKDIQCEVDNTELIY